MHRLTLAGLEESQELMKSANAYFRKRKTPDGCPGLSDTIDILPSRLYHKNFIHRRAQE